MIVQGIVSMLLLIPPAAAGDAGRPVQQLETAPALEWPSPPAEPRIRHITSITGSAKPRAFSSGAKILRWLIGLDMMQAEAARGLARPTGLYASNGVIYVADPGRPGVLKYEEAGGKSTWLGTGRNPRLVSPVAVVALPDGRIFVADSALGRVFMLHRNGAIEGELRGDPEGLGRPAGLALAQDRVFVSDVQNHRISAYDLRGIFLFSIGRRGDGDAELNFPTYLWYDASAKRLWVCDSGNFRLRSFDPEGRPLGSIGENGDRPGYLARPRGIALDSDGNVYSTDGAMEALQVFDDRGRLLLFLGKEGGGPGEFSLPGGIFIDTADRILVADTYNARVQIFQYLKPAPSQEKVP